jgi:hypothetical protein
MMLLSSRPWLLVLFAVFCALAEAHFPHEAYHISDRAKRQNDALNDPCAPADAPKDLPESSGGGDAVCLPFPGAVTNPPEGRSLLSSLFRRRPTIVHADSRQERLEGNITIEKRQYNSGPHNQLFESLALQQVVPTDRGRAVFWKT